MCLMHCSCWGLHRLKWTCHAHAPGCACSNMIESSRCVYAHICGYELGVPLLASIHAVSGTYLPAFLESVYRCLPVFYIYGHFTIQLVVTFRASTTFSLHLLRFFFRNILVSMAHPFHCRFFVTHALRRGGVRAASFLRSWHAPARCV